ncbi:hypothetical protein VNO77_30534 [Canavalia gladiata]|uniref:Uncharacterized protein n=1 Tax=Canavalia gladiata TaxID=3824 RepID=A0AAN9Q3L4_CANGL
MKTMTDEGARLDHLLSPLVFYRRFVEEFLAIPNDGKVIIVDTILSIVPETTITPKNPRGKEWTHQEFMELCPLQSAMLVLVS